MPCRGSSNGHSTGALDQSLTIFGHENQTMRTAAVAMLACPSDPAAGQVRPGFGLLSYSYGFAVADQPYLVYFGSYVGMYGAFHRQRAAASGDELSGFLRACSASSMAVSTTPRQFGLPPLPMGLSTTVIIAERALSPLSAVGDVRGPGFGRFGWVVSGNWGDTLVTAFYPPNMYRKVTPGDDVCGISRRQASMPGASMSDGYAGAIYQGYDLDMAIRPFHRSACRPPWRPVNRLLGGTFPTAGVWQALATRNGAEVVSADTY